MMEAILSVLEEISKKENIKIYIVGQYISNELLGKFSEEIEVLIEKRFDNTINILMNNIDFNCYTKEEKERTLILSNKDKKTTIKISQLEGTSLKEDLENRTITIDSMAIMIDDYNNVDIDNIIDPFDGVRDVQSKRITHNFQKMVIDDLSVILKAVRLMSQYDFDLDEDFERIIIKSKENFKLDLNQGVTEELFRILKLKNTHYSLRYLHNKLNILDLIFPEILPMSEVGECKYHVVNVLEHSFYTLEVLESVIYSNGYFEDHIRKVFERHSQKEVVFGHNKLEILKLGAFFHDIGKPYAMKIDENGRTRFRGHEITGAETIKDIAQRLNLSIKERDLLYKIVSKHMIPLVLYKKNDVSGKALYKLFKELKDETLDILLIALADIIATRKLLNPSEEMGKFKIHVEYMANNYLTRFKEIEDISGIITGMDIMKSFDFDEEIMIEDVIEEVKKAIYNGKISRSKEAALEYIEKIF